MRIGDAARSIQIELKNLFHSRIRTKTKNQRKNLKFLSSETSTKEIWGLTKKEVRLASNLLGLSFNWHTLSILIYTAYERLEAEYEILRKAILQNNVHITKRIISDLNQNKESVINFAPKVDNSLLFM